MAQPYLLAKVRNGVNQQSYALCFPELVVLSSPSQEDTVLWVPRKQLLSGVFIFLT